MPIEFKCACGQRLKVADSHAGKRAKCPKCQAELRVPDATTAPASAPAFAAAPAFSPASAPSASPDAWTVQTGEGEQYGPISKAELDQWLAEGRLDENCQLLCEGWDQWKWASEVYPSLGGAAPAPAKSDNPFDFSSAYQSPSGAGGYASSPSTYLRPHRGTLIQTLGILSFFVNPCAILSIMAWTMGNADLEEMRRGRMDPSGKSATEVGRLCGIISLVLFGVVFIASMAFVLAVGGAAAAGGR